MKPILSLAIMLFFSEALLADATCNNDANAEICVAVQNTEIDCQHAAASEYLSSCTANVAYDITNNSTADTVAKTSCSVEINYLKSVMGIRDTRQQKNSQSHNLSANSSSRFELPVTFKFSTQTEASNVQIKSVSCRVDAN